MTTASTQDRAQAARPPHPTLVRWLVRVMTTTDHKVIGKLYLVTSFCWFLVGGVMAMVMRSELAYPGQQVVNEELYNQLFTMIGLQHEQRACQHRNGSAPGSRTAAA